MAKTSIASRLTNTTTTSHVGRLRLIELPPVASYSEDDFKRASGPAVSRYRALLSRPPSTDADRLRLRRHDAWLRCALATALDRASAEAVCRFWSHAAESLIEEAWRLSGCEKAGYALLALGKLGAEELNLSSDVDLIMVRADDSPIDLKAFREFQALLSDATEFGFALRVDFTLRPGGRSAAAVPSLSEFEYHYGYHGEMWERLAYVRMRVLQGPAELTQAIQTFAAKFSFRKHLDYTLLDELKSLRTKIRQEKFETRPGAFHLKLGEGGIRELELFTHALQVIHGGRNLSLRTHSTTKALRKIKELSLLPGAECELLLEAYWYLRTLENKLHAWEDQQTYLVEPDRGHPALPVGFGPRLKSVCAQVSVIATSLFGTTTSSALLPEAIDDQKEWLERHGFSARSRDEVWPELMTATALSRRSEQDEQARKVFLQGFVAKLAEIGLDRDLGLSLLLDFVRAVRAKASFFTLLNREERVRDELATLFSISPYLGSILTSRPELIDEFIFRKQAEPSQDLGLVLDELAERRLLSELIASNHFLADSDLRKLSLNLSDNADSICRILLDRLVAEYGLSGIDLIAMGKWGGQELGLRSDLDFIFMTPSEPTQNDHKIAKRFLSRITEPHRGGSIYNVDMRLRPSGNAGPILVSENDLRSYLENKAAAWERQAYLRSRPLARLSFRPAEVAARKGLSTSDRDELRMIRSKLFASNKAGELDLKLTYGGLADIEFTAQIALLARGEFSLDPSTSGMIQYLESVESAWRSIGHEVRESYDFLRATEQLYQLTTSQSGSKMRLRSDEFRRLALVMKLSPADLETKIRNVFTTVCDRLKAVRTLDL